MYTQLFLAINEIIQNVFIDSYLFQSIFLLNNCNVMTCNCIKQLEWMGKNWVETTWIHCLYWIETGQKREFLTQSTYLYLYSYTKCLFLNFLSKTKWESSFILKYYPQISWEDKCLFYSNSLQGDYNIPTQVTLLV